MNTQHTPSDAATKVGQSAERMIDSATGTVAAKTDEALAGAKRVTADAARTVQAGIDELRDAVPGAVTRAAAQAEAATRRGIDKARHAASDVKHRAADLGDVTVHRIQDDPVKAVLIAAAVGAAATLLVQWLSRRDHHRHSM